MASFINNLINFSIITTMITTLISSYYAGKIKRLSEIKSITNIMQVDVLFDLMVWQLKCDENIKTILLIYSLAFPMIVILIGLFPSFKNGLYTWIIFLISIIAYYSIDYSSFGEEKGYYLIPSISLQLLAILVCTYNVLKHNRILKPANYLFYLMLGFLILDFFWYLGFENVITNKFNSFWQFHYFFTFYLTLFRMIYIYYVAKYLRSFLKL